MYPGNNYSQQQPYYAPVTSTSDQASLMQRVSYLLSTALLVTAGSAYFARDWSGALTIPLAIGTFACVLGLNFARRNMTLGLLLLYALSVMEGLLMGPLLSSIIRGFTLGGIIVAEATALSGIIVAGLGAYVWITNKDYGYMGKMLMYGLIGVLVIMVISFFWHSLAAMTSFQLLLSLAIVVLFVGFTLYDFSNIKHRYGPNDFIIATVQLYLDFLNLFWAILRILMMLSGGGNRSRN